jgi:hypothetical protein
MLLVNCSPAAHLLPLSLSKIYVFSTDDCLHIHTRTALEQILVGYVPINYYVGTIAARVLCTNIFVYLWDKTMMVTTHLLVLICYKIRVKAYSMGLTNLFFW